MKRTQLYLDEEVHERLRSLAERQGRTISDVVREAVARAYGSDIVDKRIDTLENVSSIWQDRKDLGRTDAYVRRMRRGTRSTRRD